MEQTAQITQLREQLIESHHEMLQYVFNSKLERIKKLGLENPALGHECKCLDDIYEVLRGFRSNVRWYNRQAKQWQKTAEQTNSDSLRDYANRQLEACKQLSAQASQTVKDLKYYWNE